MTNPTARPHTCDDCGARTKVNTRTGTLYSHTQPGTTRGCPASATLITTGTGGEPPLLPLPEPPRHPQPADRRPRGHEPSTSVRAASAGLPGHGKRR